jgi:Spy/CpxP family protein refolding chaperone
MKKVYALVVALAVMMLAPLPLVAQGGGMGQGRGGMGAARLLLEQGSVEYLVTKAADLALDAEQTASLQMIGADWAESTKESREKARKELPQPGQAGGGDREAMRARIQALQPVMAALQEQDEKALAEAMKVLNETQQTKAKQLLDERRENARPRRPGGTR